MDCPETFRRWTRYLARTDRRLFGLIVMFGIVLRVICITAFSPGDPLAISGDAVQYHHFGLSIATDPDWFGKHLGMVPPLYPLFLASVYSITGDCPRCGLYAQSLLAGLCAGMVFLIGRRLAGRAVGLLAAACVLAHPAILVWGCMLLREDLVLLTFLLTLYLALELRHDVSRSKVMLLGLAYSLLIHTDPRFLIYFPLLGLLVLLQRRWHRWRWIPALIFAGTVLILLVPWTVRNYVAYGRFVLIDVRTLGLIQMKDLGEIGYEKPPREVDELALAHGTIKAGELKPAASAVTGVREAAGSAPSVESRFARLLRIAPWNFTEFWRICRFREGYNPVLGRIEPKWSRSHNLGSILYFAPLIILSLVGTVLCFQRDRLAAIVLFAPLVVHTFLHMTQFVTQRYRLPIELIMILLSMLALVAIYERIATRRRRRRATQDSEQELKRWPLTAEIRRSIHVVIPAYNEERVIADTLRPLISGGYSIVVVDDCSTDGTWDVLKSLPVVALRHAINLGQGAALQTGMNYALLRQADFVVHFDADGQHEVADIDTLVAPLLADEADVVLGSRFLRVADREAVPGLRRWLLRAGVLVNGLLTGVWLTDAHNGFRALSRTAAEKIRLQENGFAHASEILVQIRRARLRCLERPTKICYTEYSIGKGQSAWNAVKIAMDVALRRLLK
jgi:4-amino-4-deoxy-L-arabinose transferase-like glycosyltransferase